MFSFVQVYFQIEEVEEVFGLEEIIFIPQTVFRQLFRDLRVLHSIHVDNLVLKYYGFVVELTSLLFVGNFLFNPHGTSIGECFRVSGQSIGNRLESVKD